jgi:hypothetical protein
LRLHIRPQIRALDNKKSATDSILRPRCILPFWQVLVTKLAAAWRPAWHGQRCPAGTQDRLSKQEAEYQDSPKDIRVRRLPPAAHAGRNQETEAAGAMWARRGATFEHPERSGRVTVPHPELDVPKGTLCNIEKQSGFRLR